ncbi:MAG: hypothetical protein OCU12_07225 [Methanophagales archaeon]|nr:hypothetical protein [Methanophagales archaeon]
MSETKTIAGVRRLTPRHLRYLGRVIHQACAREGLTCARYREDKWDNVAKHVYDRVGFEVPMTDRDVLGLIELNIGRAGGEWHTKMQGEGGLCETAAWTYKRMRNMIGTWAGAGRLRFEILDGGRGVKFSIPKR